MVIDVSGVMKSVLGINWRTTACAILPIVTALQKVLTAISQGDVPSSTDLLEIMSIFSLAYGLIFAKDKTVTGGSVSNVDGTSVGATVSAIHEGKVVAPALGTKA